MANSFRDSLTKPGTFTITYELVPGQGSGGRQLERLHEFARRAREDGRIKALSITDNAGGHPALAPIAIGSDVRAIGIEPLVHFSLKDKNRNQVQSHIFLYHHQCFENILVLGGDFPSSGFHGQAKPVFDLDSVQIQEMLTHLDEQGILDHAPSHGASPCRFFRGCVVSPFKLTEAEQVWQYVKLLRKIRAGAEFVITQVGFDLRKFDELIRFARAHGLDAPILGSVFIPSLGVARYMRAGKVPGIHLPASLLTAMEGEERQGRGEAARLGRAAQTIAILKGLGYQGAHIGGNGLDFDKIRKVLDLAEEAAGHWRDLLTGTDFPEPGAFYLFRPGRLGALNSDEQTALAPPASERAAMTFNHLAHQLLFEPDRPSGRAFARLCRFCARHPRPHGLLLTVERLAKGLLFACRMCGDCTLSHSLYLCPQSGCPKQLQNGPCGGSHAGCCEVHRDRPCFYVRVYGRMASADIDALGAAPSLPPKDWRFNLSSSWINFFTRSSRD